MSWAGSGAGFIDAVCMVSAIWSGIEEDMFWCAVELISVGSCGCFDHADDAQCGWMFASQSVFPQSLDSRLQEHLSFCLRSSQFTALMFALHN